MYLRKIVCENMGPISRIDIEPGFDTQGNPKPLIIVGKNGTGKSILISSIVDSFFEFGDQAYSDLTYKTNNGHAYFKISSGTQIQIGQRSMACFLKYSAGDNEEKTAEYLYHMGEFDFEKFKSCISDTYKPVSYHKTKDKDITPNNDKELFEREFRNNAIVYFPPERFSIPYWMGTAYSSSHEYGDIILCNRFRDTLNKSIIADNSTQDNTKWIIDVLVDAKAELVRDTTGYQIYDQNNYEATRQSKKNIERIISEIVEDTVSLGLGLRNSGSSRLMIISVRGKKAIAPTIDALSTGQMVLLNMFLTIIRYAESLDLNRSIRLQDITGIVVIDEIELHLHSDLQRKVLPKLIKLFPKVQFIITSHSPLFLLGMQEIFHEEGFDIYEMPDGKMIEAEDFSEFEHAHDAMRATRTYRDAIHKAILERSNANEKALIITEGPTDWKHMKRAWSKLKDSPGYAGLDGKFEFLEYEPVHEPPTHHLELHMGDNELVKICESIAKFQQYRKMIFIADADHPEKTNKLVDSKKAFKDWGNYVYSFQIPIPQHRVGQRVCIEHYYTDDELKTEKDINGKKCRLFLSGEFDERGISSDKKHICFPFAKEYKSDKNLIIEGDSKGRVSLINDASATVALPKMKFAEAILAEDRDFASISSQNFKLIFDIIKQII